MESILEIKEKLEQLERMKQVRRRATKNYYNKWIKGDGADLSEEDRVLHQQRKDEHKRRAKAYYDANKVRILERDKAKYHEAKQKKHAKEENSA